MCIYIKHYVSREKKNLEYKYTDIWLTEYINNLTFKGVFCSSFENFERKKLKTDEKKCSFI